MARDLEMDMLIKPVMDTKAFDAGVKRLQSIATKGISGLNTQQSAKFEALAARLISSLVVSGRATSVTQGRMQIQSALGRISGETAAVLRGAQNISEFAIRQGRVLQGSFSQRQIARWRPELASAATAYNNMLTSYAAFKGAPSEQSRDELLKAVLAVNTQLSNISKDRKTEIKTFGKIEKDTRAIQKEATSFKDPLKPSQTANAFGAIDYLKTGGKYLLSILGITSVVSAIKKLVGMGVQGVQQGYNDLVEQSIYGANRNIAGTRAQAKMYGFKEESLVGAERYALDFRQRMMWGEVSDKEWIALSRLGSLGQKIVSGEAARDPNAFRQEIQNYIRKNRGNEAEVRQMLGWLGWSPDLMAYGAILHESGREKAIEEIYEEQVRQNKISALATLIPSQIFKTVQDEIKSSSGRSLRSLFSGPESQNLLYRSMVKGTGFTSRETEAAYTELGKRVSDAYSGKYRSIVDTANMISPFFPGIGNIVETLYKTDLEMQKDIAQSYKNVPMATREGTKEGAKEGVLEGIKEFFRNTTNRMDKNIASIANIFSSNAGAD